MCDILLQQTEANPHAWALLPFHMICPAPQQQFWKMWSQTSTINITWDSVCKAKCRPHPNLLIQKLGGWDQHLSFNQPSGESDVAPFGASLGGRTNIKEWGVLSTKGWACNGSTSPPSLHPWTALVGRIVGKCMVGELKGV